MSPPPDRHRPTVKEVAATAGVSVASVSRVLSGSPKFVSDETRTRVLDAAAHLGYSTNVAAQALVTGRAGNIAVLVPDLGNQHFTAMVHAVVRDAGAAGFHTLIGDSSDRVEEELGLAAALLQRADGLIMCSPRCGPPDLGRLLGARKPLVTVNRRFVDLPAVASVETDVLGATREHVEALLASGHQRFAFLGARLASEQNRHRWTLIEQLVRSHGGEVWELPLDDAASGLAEALVTLLGRGCTAVLAANDLTAAEVVAVLRDLSVKVPDDVSVTGFDDTRLAHWLTPRLTTARMHEGRLGAAAWEALVRLLEDPDDVTHVTFDTSAIFRDSTGPAPHPAAHRAS
ncbi:LacI family DNA-binding transcriptional regulator [Microlunatus sagamiharensis]|uniref:LacI family DNA-binding transcriptional regulator n=1 Tax=Microlunatus sagamiharensis TaxID=546874 RepID=UPI001560C09B|nr:LacI family DNA-binding transcriptional regulator [Microlunatus sagamiharensis]